MTQESVETPNSPLIKGWRRTVFSTDKAQKKQSWLIWSPRHEQKTDTNKVSMYNWIELLIPIKKGSFYKKRPKVFRSKRIYKKSPSRDKDGVLDTDEKKSECFSPPLPLSKWARGEGKEPSDEKEPQSPKVRKLPVFYRTQRAAKYGTVSQIK